MPAATVLPALVYCTSTEVALTPANPLIDASKLPFLSSNAVVAVDPVVPRRRPNAAPVTAAYALPALSRALTPLPTATTSLPTLLKPRLPLRLTKSAMFAEKPVTPKAAVPAVMAPVNAYWLVPTCRVVLAATALPAPLVYCTSTEVAAIVLSPLMAPPKLPPLSSKAVAPVPMRRPKAAPVTSAYAALPALSRALTPVPTATTSVPTLLKPRLPLKLTKSVMLALKPVTLKAVVPAVMAPEKAYWLVPTCRVVSAATALPAPLVYRTSTEVAAIVLSPLMAPLKLPPLSSKAVAPVPMRRPNAAPVTSAYAALPALSRALTPEPTATTSGPTLLKPRLPLKLTKSVMLALKPVTLKAVVPAVMAPEKAYWLVPTCRVVSAATALPAPLVCCTSTEVAAIVPSPLMAPLKVPFLSSNAVPAVPRRSPKSAPVTCA